MGLAAANKAGVPVPCLGCGHEFAQDPPFMVACPECHAKIGQYCKRPSGHQGKFNNFHAVRDVEALRQGFYDHDSMGEKCGPHSSSPRAAEIVAAYSRPNIL